MYQKARTMTIFEPCISEWARFLALLPIELFRIAIYLIERRATHLRFKTLGAASK